MSRYSQNMAHAVVHLCPPSHPVPHAHTYTHIHTDAPMRPCMHTPVQVQRPAHTHDQGHNIRRNTAMHFAAEKGHRNILFLMLRFPTHTHTHAHTLCRHGRAHASNRSHTDTQTCCSCEQNKGLHYTHTPLSAQIHEPHIRTFMPHAYLHLCKP